MFVESEHALVLVVVPKTVKDLPIKEVYEANRKGRWTFAIVELSCVDAFERDYGDLPWDEVWHLDLTDDVALEKTLVDIQYRAKEKKPLPRPTVPTPAPRPSPIPWEPSPKDKKRKKHEWVTPKWERTHSNWSDQGLRSVQKKIRQMARTSF